MSSMDWLMVVTAVGSAVAAVAAGWAAFQATRLVSKTQEQVATSQHQVDVSQRELFAGQRPVLVPTRSVASVGADGLPYVDLDGVTEPSVVAGIKNIGPGPCFALRLVLFGRSPTTPGAVLPSRRYAWDLPAIAGGEELGPTLAVGGTVMNGDVCINSEPLLTLFAPPMPTRDQNTFGGTYVMLGRLTMTYSDIYDRKHAAVWDLDTQQHWHLIAYRDDIPKDLDDLQRDALAAMRPRTSAAELLGVGNAARAAAGET